jgi:membrane protease YdiL (CAAX protease family)
MSRQSRQLVIFFLGTFAWTWACYFTIVLLHLHPYQGPGLPLLLAGGSAPSWMGIILAMATRDRSGRLRFWRRFYDIRLIGFGWLALIVMLFPAIAALSIGVDVLLGGTLPGMTALKAILANPLLFFPGVLLSFFSGPFSEEFGWRGFALDPLLARFGFVRASVLLGLLWGVWHLPLYFMPETWHGKMGFRIEGFWAFVLGSVGLSVIISWVYLGTGRSILAAMLVHLSSNHSTQLISGSTPTGFSPRLELVLELMLIAIGLLVCVRMRQVTPSPERETDAVAPLPVPNRVLP